MGHLEKIEAELRRYEHPLVSFSAEACDRGVEVSISLKVNVPGCHVYHAPVHERDVENPQFPWIFQRYLYDCLHDYMVELFTRTPQTREEHS